MQIRFKTQASELNAALAIVGVVAPRPITPQGGSGYLFVVRGERCFLYSRDTLRVARADFAIEPVEGEGAFIYPAENIGLLNRAGDGVITFTASSEGDTHKVAFSADSGAKDSRATYDFRLMATCDKDFEAASNEKVFSVGILKEALRQAKPFLADDSHKQAEDHHKTVQVFDSSKPEWAKGDGTLYAATGVTSFWFQSEEFVGKGLSVHGQHLGFLSSFLGRSEGRVTLRRGQNMSFAVNEKGHVLGWTHHEKTHGKYAYYSLSNDAYIIDVPVSATLSALKYMQAGLAKAADKIRVTFEAAAATLTFSAVSGSSETNSFPVPVLPHEESKAEDLQFWCNINHIMDILADAKGDRVMMRIAIIPKSDKRPKDTAMIRTIDTFLMDKDGKIVPGSEDNKPEGAFACRVTRFVPSKD